MKVPLGRFVLFMLFLVLLAALPGAQAKGNDTDTGGFGYVWADQAGGASFFEYQKGSAVLEPAPDDVDTLLLPAGFNFTYYDKTYTAGDTLYVAEDGFLAWSSPAANTWEVQDVPDPAAVNDLIAPFWSDQRVHSDCDEYVDNGFQPTGVDHNISWAYLDAQYDRLVVSYDGVAAFMDSLGDTICTEWNVYSVDLINGTDIIEFHYKDTDDIQGGDEPSASCTTSWAIGQENATGATGLSIDDRIRLDPDQTGCVSMKEQAYRIFVNNGTDAQRQRFFLDAGTSLSFTLDVSDDPLHYKILEAPVGTVVGLADGDTHYMPPQVTYEAGALETGNTSLRYQVSDGYDPATQTLVNFSVNGAPQAVDDDYLFAATDGDVPLDVLANDFDLFYSLRDGNESWDTPDFWIKSVEQPLAGTILIDEDGKGLTYQQPASHPGRVTFTYTITDGRLEASADVVFTVNDPPHPPAHTFVIDENDPMQEWNLTDGTTDAFYSKGEGNVTNPVNHTLVDFGPASLGTLALSPADDHIVEYTPSPATNGTDTWTYNVTDGLDTVQGNVTVEINARPTPADDEFLVHGPHDYVVLDVLANDSDPHYGTLELESVDPPFMGDVEIEDNKLNYTPLEGAYGAFSLHHTVTDGRLEENAVAVLHINAPPEARNDTYDKVRADVVDLPLDVLFNDMDDYYSDWRGQGGFESFGSPELRITSVAAQHGFATHDGSIVEFTPRIGHASDTITYTISDGVFTSEANVTINFEQDLYVWTDTLTVAEGEAALLTTDHLEAYDGYTDDPSFLYRLVAAPEHGVLLLNGQPVGFDGFTQQQMLAGQVSYLHDGGEDLGDLFWVRLSNATNHAETVKVPINVDAVDDPPQLQDMDTITIAPSESRLFGIHLLNITDVDTLPQDVRIKPVLEPSLIEFRMAGAEVGSFSLEAMRKGNVHVAGLEAGKSVLKFQVQDAANTVFFDLPVWVDIPNAPPFMTGQGVTTVDWGRQVTVTELVFGWNDHYDTRDDNPSGIILVIDEAPAYGTLLKENVALGINDTFTQHDIQTGRIVYNHHGRGHDADDVRVTVYDSTPFWPGPMFAHGVLEIVVLVPEPNGAVDRDNDGQPTLDQYDERDTCPGISDPGYVDEDNDNISDACDPVVTRYVNLTGPADEMDGEDDEQEDVDAGPQVGDLDGDGLLDNADNCPAVHNPSQANLDADAFGDRCDEDVDGDGVLEGGFERDNCPRVANPSQEDRDGDGIGDACSQHGESVFAGSPARNPVAQEPVAGRPAVEGGATEGVPAWAVALGIGLMALVGIGITVWGVRRGMTNR